MAFGGRELMLILRASNQASGPIRQVARDLRMLGTSGTAAGKSAGQLANARMWSKIGLAGSILRDTGRTGRLAGIGIAAGLGFAATAAAKFQTQAGLVATQTGSMNLSIGRTTAEMQKNARIIETGVLQQMGKFPASAEEMNSALYEIFSSTELGSDGIEGVNDGLKLLTLMNKAAVAGQTDLSEVTKATTSVMNAFGGGVEAIPKRLERMFAAVRFGRMTFADFTNTFSQIVPATQAAGQSFDTMTGTMAALTRLMPNVRFAATAYARMLEIFGRKKFVDGAKKFGVEMQDARGNLRPLPQIIDDFRVAINKLPLKEQAPMIRNFFKALSNQEGTIQARRAFTALIKHPKLYRKVLGQTVRDNNEFTKSFRLMADRAGVRWETFVNRMRATFIKLGAAAIPILIELLEPVTRLVNWFNKLDKETQKQIANWAAMGAAILIVGGTIAALAGNIIMILAAFKVGGYSLSIFLVALTAIAAVLLTIAGHGNLVRGALDRMVSSATSSVQNFIMFVGLATVAVLRLKNAILATATVAKIGGALTAGAAGIASAATKFRAAQAAFAVTAIPAGRIPKGEPGAGRFRSAQDFNKTARAANAMKVGFAGASVAAAGMAAALLPTIGIIAAIGAGTLLWARHQKQVADEAERLARFRAAAAVPTTGAQQAAGLGKQLMTLRQAQINLRSVNLQIKEQTKNMKGLTGSAKEQAKLNLDQLWLNYGQAVADVSHAQQRIVTTSGSLKNALQGVATNMQGIVARRAELRELRQEFGYMAVPPSRVSERIRELQQEIADLGRGAAGFAPIITKSMGQALRMLERVRLVPQMTAKQFGQAREAAARFATQVGRAPTLKEFRQIVRAVLDPKSLKDIPAQIRRAIGIVKIEAKVEVKRGKVADLNRQVQDAFRHREPTIAPKAGQLIDAKAGLRQAQAARAQMAGPFKKAIEQQITVKKPPNLHAIGRSISEGIQAGMMSVHQQVVIDKVVNSIDDGFGRAIDRGSPSRRFAKSVGVPIITGVIVGMLSKAREAADAAVFVIDQIEGKTIAKMTAFLKKQAQLFQTMNANLNALVRRGVPMQLVQQLAQMGKDGAKQIAKLASASQVELNKFVAAWRRAQAQLKNSSKFNWDKQVEIVETAAQKLLALYNQMTDNLKGFLRDSIADMSGFSQQVADSVEGAFGAIFQGPMNIAARVGPAFDEAMASYRDSMAGLQQQMEDLQQQQADTIADFMERRRDELRQAFGQLFQGPILSGGFAAGSVKDLIADLNKQLEAFQNWRKNLDALAKKGVPPELMKQLEELGPEAAHNLGLLVGATDEELAEWIAAWKAGQGAIEEVTQATFMNMDGFAEAMADIAKQMAAVAKQMSQLVAPKKATFADLLADLQAQQVAWQDYNSILTNLHARGVPGKMLAELAALGIDGVEILRILNSGTDQELATYISTWNQKQKDFAAAKKAWHDTLAPEEIIGDLKATVGELEEFDAIIAALKARGLDPAILKWLQELGPTALPLLRGLNAMTKFDLLDESNPDSFVNLWKRAHKGIDTAGKEFVSTQIALWKTAGGDIARGLIAGVMEEQGELLAFFRNLFKQLLKESNKQVGNSSPSKEFFEVGVNIVKGFQNGLDSMTTSLSSPKGPTIGRGSITGGLLASGNGGINMTVNAHHSEALQTTLERTAFRMRQRRIN